MAFKLSQDNCESTSNLLYSKQNFKSTSSSSDFVIPMDTGSINDGCDISIENVKVEQNCDSLNVQIQAPFSEKQHRDENNLSSYDLIATGEDNVGQTNVRTVEFSEPDATNKRSSKRRRPIKFKFVGKIFPILGHWGKTYNKGEHYWSRTINRISRLNTGLLEAIEKHNNNDVERILKAGANPNATCCAGHVTACHAAAYANSDALRLLLKSDANKNRRDKFGRTPLHFAAWAGRTDTISMLLNFNTDLQNKVMYQATPEEKEEITVLRPRSMDLINVPCELPNFVCVVRQMWRDRIEHKCQTFMTHIPKFFPGWTAVHIASYAAHHEATRLLLGAGANPNSRDAAGQTPLDVVGAACYLHSTRINVDEYVKTIKTLIEFGGKLNVSDTSPTNSALHTAVELCSVEAAQVLLEAGAPVSHRNNNGNTPLHECVAKRCKELFQVLVIHDRLGDVVDSSGYTVLQTAILASWTPGVCIALDAGADVTYEAYDGKTAIHLAALNGNLDILNEILRNAAQYPNAINHDNGRAEPIIFCAIRSGNMECVQALIINAKATLEMTYYVEPVHAVPISTKSGLDRKPVNMILHATAEVGGEDMLALLFEHDQRLEELLCYQCSYLGNMIPVEFAAFHNKFDSFRFLLQKTLKVMLKLQQSFNPSRLLYIISKKEKIYLQELIKQIPNALQTRNSKKYYYPLHDAAKRSNRNRIVHLIDNGADLSELDKDNNTAISLIIQNISKPTEFLAKILDAYILKTDKVKSSTECNITVDYRMLIPWTEHSLDKSDQMRVVTALLETKDRQNQRKLLAHPLIESFLYLKWKSLSTYFYLMVLFYFIFVMSLSLHTMSVFYYKDKYNKTMLETGIVPRVWDSNIWIYIIYFTLAFVAIQELSCLNLSPKTWAIKNSRELKKPSWAIHFLTIEYLVKFVTYSLAIATPLVISMECDVNHGELDWRRQLATVTLVMAWSNIMMMISKTPMSGYYIEMFWIVLIKVIEIFVTFSFLILMFSFCFMIQFHSQTPFEGPWSSIVKTLVMMTSEFDYGDTFTREKAENLSTPISVLRAVFVIFLILTAIVLMNLMIGVAVHDVQNLMQDGNIKRLEKQVAFLNRLEVSRRRKKSFLYLLGIHQWFKCNNVPQTVTFEPVNKDKCPYSALIKEAIINKVQEQIDRKEKETELNKLESKLKKLSQDASNKLGSKLEKILKICQTKWK